MAGKKKTKIAGGVEDAAAGKSQIAWAGKLDMSLTLLMKNHWATYSSCRNKMDWCRKWSILLGITSLDPNGDKTKAHITYLVGSYTRAKELLKQTGAGTIVKTSRLGGKQIREELTLDQQVERLCPCFEVLDSFLGARATVIMGDGVGLGMNGLKGELRLGEAAAGPAGDKGEDSDEPEEKVIVDPSLGLCTQSLLNNMSTQKQAAFGYSSLTRTSMTPTNERAMDTSTKAKESSGFGSISTSTTTLSSNSSATLGPRTPGTISQNSEPIASGSYELGSADDSLEDNTQIDMYNPAEDFNFDATQNQSPLNERGKGVSVVRGEPVRESSRPPSSVRRGRKRTYTDDWDVRGDDDEDPPEKDVEKPAKEMKLAHGTNAKIVPRKKPVANGGGLGALGGIESLVTLTKESRAQKQKMWELKMKARIARNGGGTDEQREHEIVLAKLQMEMKKHELEAINLVKLKELELKQAELELKRKYRYERSRSRSRDRYNRSRSRDRYRFYNWERDRSDSRGRRRSPGRSERARGGQRHENGHRQRSSKTPLYQQSPTRVSRVATPNSEGQHARNGEVVTPNLPKPKTESPLIANSTEWTPNGKEYGWETTNISQKSQLYPAIFLSQDDDSVVGSPAQLMSSPSPRVHIKMEKVANSFGSNSHSNKQSNNPKEPILVD